MKKILISLVIVLATVFCVNAQPSAQSAQGKLTISNKSDYTITVKVMYADGGLYTTKYISAHSSSSVSFSRTNRFYTKTKASKGLETLYRKGDVFEIVSDSRGYTEASLEFYVSGGYGASGQSISKAEFEKDY